MQYDENAEKYGYEGEMTPIECNELKPYTYDDMIDGDADTNIEYYSKSDADAIIAQKDFEIDRLKEFNAFLKQRNSNGDVGCSILLDDLQQKDKEIAELKDKCQMHDFFWEGCGFAKRGFKNTIAVSEAFDRLEAENAELKAKLEDAKASAYAESVDVGMENRRLKRALWLARAEWARSSALSYHLIESHPDKDVSATYKRKANKWEKAKDKCLKKAEEYK